MIPLHDNNPTEIFPAFTVALIVACVFVFFWQLSLGEAGQQAVYALGVIPAALLQGKTLAPEIYLVSAEITLLTSMFLHGGWMHLIGNMLYLWIFGNNIEDAMGHTRFIVFYVICGIAAALAQSIPNPSSVIPMIGASGAISGVLGAYLILYPRARVLVVIPLGFYFFSTRLPAMVVLGVWFVFQIVSSLLADNSSGGVAWGAHVGGFVAGVLLIPFFKYRRVKFFR